MDGFMSQMARSECIKKARRMQGFFQGLDAWWSEKDYVERKEDYVLQRVQRWTRTRIPRSWIRGEDADREGGSHTNGDIAAAQWMVHDIALDA